MEWECAIKDAQVGAKEGAEFIKKHIIKVTDRAFDDFASSGGGDPEFNNKILGI
jgi:hypothetical protein